jgi:hypothetical protein
LELRLAPEYRRCALYVAVGYLLFATAVICGKLEENDNAPWSTTIAGLSVIGIGTLGLFALVQRYRIRIDEKGVWRRRFWHWDLWPWEAFELGKVRHGKLGDQWTYPDKSWYWRTISASVLGKSDRAALETVVARYRIAPAPPEPRDVIVVKYGLHNTLELSADGVRLGWRGSHAGEPIAWRQVIKAEVLRASHDRPDFQKLGLQLPEHKQPVFLRCHQGTPCFTGATAEEIAEFLRRRLDEGRFEVTALRGRPADLPEADRRLALLDEAEQQLRTLRRIGWWMYGISVPLMTTLVVEPWNKPNPINWDQDEWLSAVVAFVGFAVLLGLQIGMIFGVAYFRRRDLRESRAELLRWKAELHPVP